MPLRVALVAGADPGHLFPILGLRDLLVSRGHDCRVWTVRKWLPLLAARGIEACDTPSLAALPGNDESDIGARLYARAARVGAALAPELAAYGPDVVVHDVLMPGAGLAAELRGIPPVPLEPHPLSTYSRGLPPYGSGLAPGRTIVTRARDVLLRSLTRPALRVGERQRAAARTSVGLPPVEPLPLRHLVATLPGLELPRPDWPAHAVLVPPLHWEPASTDLALPPGDAPLVAVVESTAAGGAGGLLRCCREGLPELRMAQVVLDEDRAWSADRVTVGPGRLGPLIAAADVVVGGGGHGVLSRSLLAGRPLVVVPGGGDQPDLAQRLARAGAGVAVPSRRLSASTLAAAVRAVLAEPGYASAARSLGSGRGADPVREIERAVRAGA